MTYKVLLIGLGQIGMGYDIGLAPQSRVATLARAFSEHPLFTLVGGVDIDEARLQLFRTHYHKLAYKTVKSALEETAPDVVAIAVPTAYHHQVFCETLRWGSVKAILCEKPLAYDLHHAEDMVQLAQNAGIRLYTNYMRRCDKGVVEVRRRILSGSIVAPLKGSCWYTKGIFNNGSHYINLLQYWLGEARGLELIGKRAAGDVVDPDVDLRMEFDLGEVYFHACDTAGYAHHSLELFASNGRLLYERGALTWQFAESDHHNARYITLSSSGEQIPTDLSRLQWLVADQIAKDLVGEMVTICTGIEGLSTIKILNQIRETL